MGAWPKHHCKKILSQFDLKFVIVSEAVRMNNVLFSMKEIDKTN